VVFSSAVIYDHLTAEVADLPAETPMQTIGEPVTVSVGDASLEAGSFRLDPLLHQPHVLKGVVMRMPRYAIEGESATILQRGKGVVFRKADLTAGGLRGRIGALALAGTRIVFRDVRARGGLVPFHVTEFEAGSMSLPAQALAKKKLGLEQMVDGLSDDTPSGTDARPGAMEFGFKRLEFVVTMLFQRGFIRRGFLNLSGGKTKVRFVRGMYSVRHDKIYLTDTEVVRDTVRLFAKDAEIRMKTGTLVLSPPVEKRTGEKVETMRDIFEIQLR
jgi:hypothetical protein